MEHKILTKEETAEYLKTGKRSVYKLAETGEIPSKIFLNSGGTRRNN